MTPVITAAMSKLIKVVGSLSHFHVEAHVAQRRFPVIAVAELPFGQVYLTFWRASRVKMTAMSHASSETVALVKII